MNVHLSIMVSDARDRKQRFDSRRTVSRDRGCTLPASANPNCELGFLRLRGQSPDKLSVAPWSDRCNVYQVHPGTNLASNNFGRALWRYKHDAMNRLAGLRTTK